MSARPFVTLVTNVALALYVSACGPKTSALDLRPTAPVDSSAQRRTVRPSAEEELKRDLQGIFSSASIDHAIWGVSVRSLKSGESLFSLNSGRMQTPASNQKVVTSAVAAERLGWDYRFTTTIYGTGLLSEGGDLEGDLIVVSNGDPTINSRHPDRVDAFDAWAKQLYEKGLRRVNGQLIGDDSAFAEPGWGVGWAWDDLSLGYGAPVSALQYNENEIDLQIGPAMDLGNKAIITVSPPGSGVAIDNTVTTVAAGQPNRISLDRVPGSSTLKVSGQIAAGSTPINDSAAAPNPTILYINALRDALMRNGIFIIGSSQDIDDARVKPDYQKAMVLLEDRSPTLDAVIDVCMKWSQNLYAETMLRSLAPAGPEATSEAGLAVVADTLTKWGVPSQLYVARDGSGLSRNDYLAPDVLVTILTKLWGDPRHQEKYRATLPQSATSGSLANRMKDSVAAGRVWAKTGSMSNVRSLSGYVVTQDGEPLVFSFMTTSFRMPFAQVDATMEEALRRLARFPRDLHEE